MAGVEAERSSSADTQVGLLAYFQDDTRKSWGYHHDQHDLEQKALELALARVADNTEALDKALQLAVRSVRDEQQAMRELLETQIAALSHLLDSRIAALDAQTHTFDSESLARWENHFKTHAAESHTQEGREQEWVASLHRLQDEKQKAHDQIHSASQRAIDLADKSMTEKLGEMNQLRQQITSERGTYVNRDMLDSRMATITTQAIAGTKANESRIGALERTQNIAYGIMLVLVFAIPLGLKLIP